MAKNKGGSKSASSASAKASSGGMGKAITAAGANVSKNEALKIAEQTGKTVAQVMAAAVQKGATLGTSLVNNFNSGNLGPNFKSVGYSGTGAPVLRGQNAGVYKALDQLRGLQGLKLGSGQAYAGYSTTTTPAQVNRGVNDGHSWTPGSTTYNPVVVPKNYAPGGGKPAAAPAPAAPATGPVADWENSVNNSNQVLIDSINAQIAANAEQAQLYMGQIDMLMASMQQADQAGALQTITPYAVTTATVDPATGAQTTSAVAPRPKPTDTDLSITPLVADLVGTGLNIGI